jgi:hypothetical protein
VSWRLAKLITPTELTAPMPDENAIMFPCGTRIIGDAATAYVDQSANLVSGGSGLMGCPVHGTRCGR